MAEELKEREIEAGNTSPATSETSPHGGKEFAPIGGLAHSRSRNSSLARAPTSLRSISHSRSNNWYGCDDVEDLEEVGDGEAREGEAGEGKDHFEVRWDGGEREMNPRSLGLGRKWIVVLIVSASSMCV
jgi:hypothetical protein